MAALEDISIEFVQDFFSGERNTVKSLSEHLKEQFPDTCGFSTRSIERFCKEHGIKRKGILSNDALDRAVDQAVSQVRTTFNNICFKYHTENNCKIHCQLVIFF